MNEPIVGILLNDRTFNGIRRGRTAHEALPLYEHAALRLNCQVCYFRLQDISIKNKTVHAIIPEPHGQGFQKRLIPLPSVIHNRAIHLHKKANLKLARLHAAGYFIYNRQTRYSKWFIHRLLMKDESIRPHLPETHLATVPRIRSMMRRYNELIIKPANGSIGRGIMKLKKRGERWRLVYRSLQRPRRWRGLPASKRLPSVLRHAIRRKTYLVQQCIPLATYLNRPFDLRVSVQRNRTGAWQVTGIIGKVAPAKLFLTNVAQGGSVYTLDHLLYANASLDPHLHPHDVCRNVETFALRVAEHLGKHLVNLADIGLDIGITPQGFPMFIECNCRDLRYSFQEGGMEETWAETYHQPISYGHSVAISRYRETIANVSGDDPC